jgi:Trk K+ transport system NAD-binding subunit/nucleotide-binding universal stress UspA family protein
MQMRIVIVGAGGTGKELASRLASRHQILLVDNRVDCLRPYGTPIQADKGAVEEAAQTGITCVRGDGSSRLVLQALYSKEWNCALVAVAGNDEVNLEVGRLGRAVGFDPVIAVQHGDEYADRYGVEHITAIDRSDLLADQVELSLHHKGAVVPSGIGLGRGELVEIRLVRTSPILNRPLKQLAPHRWRVAAVFRGNELIVPTGDTTLQMDDRVLLVGDPKILPTVAEYLRLGTPQFPRPYGANVATLEFRGPDEDLHREAEGLACASGAVHLVRGIPGAEDTSPAEEPEILSYPECKGDVERATFPLPGIDDPGFAEKVASRRAGVLVVRPRNRGFFARLLGMRGSDAELCDRLGSPVLFSRGSFPYRKILLPVSASEISIHAAEMAIDITRQLGGALTAVNVDLPRYISGLSEEDIHREVVPVRKLCELYEVPLDYRHREGNPVRGLLAEAASHNLVVMARRHGRRDNYFDPDVALRVARRAACSVIVLTVRPGE